MYSNIFKCLVLPVDEDTKKNHLKWLPSIDQSVLYNSNREERTEGTGQWFLDNKLKDLMDSRNNFLWLHGKRKSFEFFLVSGWHLQSTDTNDIAGAGKSVLW